MLYTAEYATVSVQYSSRGSAAWMLLLWKSVVVASDQQVPEHSKGWKRVQGRRNKVHGPADVSAFGFWLEKGN